MNRMQLKELLRNAIYEVGETKRANKEKKKAAGFSTQVAKDFARGKGPGQTKHTGWNSAGDPDSPGGFRLPATKDARAQSRAAHGYVSTTRNIQRGEPASGDPLGSRPGRADVAAFTRTDAKPPAVSTLTFNPIDGLKKTIRGDMDAAASTVRGADTYMGTTPQGTMKTSPIPPEVKQAASKEAGGRVVFGHYYDASGTPLGKTVGGEWIPASDPRYKNRQLEVYQKLEEIESKGYKIKDKEMVKEMIREVMKSCK